MRPVDSQKLRVPQCPHRGAARGPAQQRELAEHRPAGERVDHLLGGLPAVGGDLPHHLQMPDTHQEDRVCRVALAEQPLASRQGHVGRDLRHALEHRRRQVGEHRRVAQELRDGLGRDDRVHTG